MNIFEEANAKIDSFIINNLDSYHKLRNYDFGKKNRTNVSQISKYMSHRILCEYQLLERLKKVDKKKKFTDEILWRLYWRGYLENYKSIWIDYKSIFIKEFTYDRKILEKATHGKTGIECFDSWVEELRDNNYLHNHARMWFASMWIFTLKLPWKLGSNFFMRHLLDGDAASNTLSWRWVAGMHTNNKPYLATTENIKKFTVNRFKNYPINSFKIKSQVINSSHISTNLPKINNTPHGEILLIFDNDLGIDKRFKLLNSYNKIYIIFNELIEDGSKFSSNVINFKKKMILNIQALIPNSQILNLADVNLFLNNYEVIDVIYPGVGNNLDFLHKYSKINKISINYIYRDNDLIYWNYADKGFNKFKRSVCTLNES